MTAALSRRSLSVISGQLHSEEVILNNRSGVPILCRFRQVWEFEVAWLKDYTTLCAIRERNCHHLVQ